MPDASTGENPVPFTLRQSVRVVGAVLATVFAVPYALFVVAAPLSLVTPQVVGDIDLSSTDMLARAITAATGGLLVAAIAAAGAVGRRVPAHLVCLSGLVMLAGASLWMRSVGGLGELALARTVQGAGAGAVLVATLAAAATFGSVAGRTLTGAWALSVVGATAVAPWATYRLPFDTSGEWRAVLAPYPWMLALALAGTATVVLAASLPGRLPAGADAHTGTAAEPRTNQPRMDRHAGRLGLPLVLPVVIAVGDHLLRPSLSPASGTVTLYSLLMVTALAIIGLGAVLLARAGGWWWGAAPPVVAAAAAVLTVAGDNAFTVALFDGGGHWPLATGHVLPALGGAALAGGLAVVAGIASPRRVSRTLTVTGLLVAAGAATIPLAGGMAPTAVGTILVWAGVGLALGATLRVTGAVAGAWVAAGFAVVGALATMHAETVRTAFTTRAVGDADADLTFLRTGFANAQRTWVVISCALLLLTTVLVARTVRTSLSAPDTAPGSGSAGADLDPKTTTVGEQPSLSADDLPAALPE